MNAYNRCLHVYVVYTLIQNQPYCKNDPTVKPEDETKFSCSVAKLSGFHFSLLDVCQEYKQPVAADAGSQS